MQMPCLYLVEAAVLATASTGLNDVRTLNDEPKMHVCLSWSFSSKCAASFSWRLSKAGSGCTSGSSSGASDGAAGCDLGESCPAVCSCARRSYVASIQLCRALSGCALERSSKSNSLVRRVNTVCQAGRRGCSLANLSLTVRFAPMYHVKL